MIPVTPTKTLTSIVLCLLTVLPASGGSAEAPEILDPAGDAAALGVPLGAGAASLDIVRGWFETRAQTTTVHLVTAGGDARAPNAVLTVAFRVGDADVWAGYGRVVMPEGVVESFYGCRSDGAEDDGDCRDLAGEARPDGRGFAVEIPADWLPAGATARDPRARAYLLEPPVTEMQVFGGLTFDEAGPGSAYTSPRSVDARVDTASVGSPAEDPRAVPGAGALAAAVAGLAAALALAARRP